MPNPYKVAVLETLRSRFGGLRKIQGSESLFVLGNNAARIYIRYSKVHPDGGAFFGIREVDLRQLEGYNSFFCFLVDDGTAPLLVPYADFEEVFRNAQTATDGQYKVQLRSGNNGRELYVARQGRYNVEGYMGFDHVVRSVDSGLLRAAHSLTHSQVQTLLASIGHLKKFDVYLPECDAGRLDWSLVERFALRASIPSGFEAIRGVLCEVDVIWVRRGGDAIEGLFEVEHTTTVYSGLLRFNDIHLTDPRVTRFSIVSDESRRDTLRAPALQTYFQKEWTCRTYKLSGVLKRAGLAQASCQGW